ncbi:MAG: dynamin family protein [Coleofasciculaceae cyanobacterium]
MNYQVVNSRLLQDLERVSIIRQKIANHLGTMADTLSQGELEGEKASGKLGLDSEIEDISLASKNLREGVFRLMVLGDLKRGKSTFLNALIGEKLLPSDVNPCTALLTILRYGLEKKVTVYFKEDKPAESLDFQTFKQQYTIDPSEAKRLEQENKQAFPNVSHAVVEYPLPLLEKGIEIVDSPGLNDTEARNELSLNYINNCHAILFVFRAAQPCTLEERRYLENYIKDRGLSVFFLINAWDEVSKGLIDPDDPQEIAEAEEKLRQVFYNNIAPYCQLNGDDIYQERVFEISSLAALRRRLKNPDDSLEGTGFSEFSKALNTFLTQERAVAEMRQARTLARLTYNRTHEAIERRLPLLEEDVQELREKISSVEPEFQQLTKIREQFQSEVRTIGDRQANDVADSLRQYILNLGETFESDFSSYQPDLDFIASLSQEQREAFQAAFKRAFEQYINDKIAAWELTVRKELREAFSQLAKIAANHGATYSQVTDVINEKLTGKKVRTSTNFEGDDDSPGWAKWAMGFLGLTSGNLAGVVLAGAGFDWQNILVNFIAVLGITSSLAIFTGAFIGPIGIALVGLGIGAWQIDNARKELIKTTRKELVKHLPQMAQEQWQTIHQAVKEVFNSYEREVSQRISNDINARQAELDNLLEQKESREINLEIELKRLRSLDADILSQSHLVESVYADLLS